LSRKQILVLAGIIPAAIVVALAWTGSFGTLVPLPEDNPVARLSYALPWLLIPALALLAGIGMTGNTRFFSAEAIDGTRKPESNSLEINLRYNQNTLEQTVLAAIAWPLLALWLPLHQLGLIPVLSTLFGIGRAAFLIGYMIAPWARAFGMGLTFYPTVVALVWLVVRAVG